MTNREWLESLSDKEKIFWRRNNMEHTVNMIIDKQEPIRRGDRGAIGPRGSSGAIRKPNSFDELLGSVTRDIIYTYTHGDPDYKYMDMETVCVEFLLRYKMFLEGNNA